MPTHPTLPSLRSILNVVERYRAIACRELYSVVPEIDDPTLDVPRVGYTRQCRLRGQPNWEVVQRGVPWDHTIHSLRHFRDVAECFDGYAFISVAYTTQELALETSYKGTVPPQIGDAFTVAVWPVFAVQYKAAKWVPLDTPNGVGKTMVELYRENGLFVFHTSDVGVYAPPTVET